MHDNKLTPTKDGSLTLWQPELREHYHNLAGAYTEALENYARPALAALGQTPPRTLCMVDACFGLGYNSFVLIQQLLKSEHPPTSIRVIAIETDSDLAQIIPAVLNQPCLNDLKSISRHFEHNVYYQTQNRLIEFSHTFENGTQLSFEWLTDSLLKCAPALEANVDVVFHDPFSPRLVPELWTVDLFRHYHRLTKARRGHVLTYSSAGAVRGGLREAGFHLSRTTGVGVKQGGTLASQSADKHPDNPTIQPLSQSEEAFIASRAGIPYRDSSLMGNRSQILNQRLQEQDCSGRQPAVR